MEVRLMMRQKEFARIVLLSVLALTVVVAGAGIAQEAQEQAAQEKPAAAGGETEFEGVVKAGLGKYFYLPSASGFDIFIQGTVEGQDASFLEGKEVRVKGALLKDDPSVFIADSIDLKEGNQYRNVFTRTSEPTLEGHLSANQRQEFQQLKITRADKSEDWEGKEKGKIYGKLITQKSPDGKETYTISVLDDAGKAVGTVLVDDMTTYAKYYIKKLRLFDHFWFYLNIKDTVDFRVRRRTRELFHADVLFAGLY
jgi:hypothetical protein